MLRPVSAGMLRILKGVLPVELCQKWLNYCLRGQAVQVVASVLTAVTPAKLPWCLSELWCDCDEALVASAESSSAVCACWVASCMLCSELWVCCRYKNAVQEILVSSAGKLMLAAPGGRVCASVMERREATGTCVGQGRDL